MRWFGGDDSRGGTVLVMLTELPGKRTNGGPKRRFIDAVKMVTARRRIRLDEGRRFNRCYEAKIKKSFQRLWSLRCMVQCTVVWHWSDVITKQCKNSLTHIHSCKQYFVRSPKNNYFLRTVLEGHWVGKGFSPRRFPFSNLRVCSHFIPPLLLFSFEEKI